MLAGFVLSLLAARFRACASMRARPSRSLVNAALRLPQRLLGSPMRRVGLGQPIGRFPPRRVRRLRSARGGLRCSSNWAGRSASRGKLVARSYRCARRGSRRARSAPSQRDCQRSLSTPMASSAAARTCARVRGGRGTCELPQRSPRCRDVSVSAQRHQLRARRHSSSVSSASSISTKAVASTNAASAIVRFSATDASRCSVSRAWRSITVSASRVLASSACFSRQSCRRRRSSLLAMRCTSRAVSAAEVRSSLVPRPGFAALQVRRAGCARKVAAPPPSAPTPQSMNPSQRHRSPSSETRRWPGLRCGCRLRAIVARHDADLASRRDSSGGRFDMAGQRPRHRQRRIVDRRSIRRQCTRRHPRSARRDRLRAPRRAPAHSPAPRAIHRSSAVGRRRGLAAAAW